jgi:hypothetical protein
MSPSCRVVTDGERLSAANERRLSRFFAAVLFVRPIFTA